MAIMELVMKSKLDIDWAAMKWSIDSSVESICAFEDAEKNAGGINGVPLITLAESCNLNDLLKVTIYMGLILPDVRVKARAMTTCSQSTKKNGKL